MKHHKFLLNKCLKFLKKKEVDRRILKCEKIRYSPAEISTIKTPNSEVYINMPREDSLSSLLNSYRDSYFVVVKMMITADMEKVMIYG